MTFCFQAISAQEDSAQLTFRKTAVSKKSVEVHTVRENEAIYGIIRNLPGVAEKDIALFPNNQGVEPPGQKLGQNIPGTKDHTSFDKQRRRPERRIGRRDGRPFIGSVRIPKLPGQEGRISHSHCSP